LSSSSSSSSLSSSSESVAHIFTWGENSGDDYTGITSDTYIYEAQTLYNYGISTNLNVYATGGSGRISLVRFGLAAINGLISVSSQIISATLYVYNTGSSQTIKIARMTVDWIEGTKNGATAGTGEPCWNFREYNTVAWNPSNWSNYSTDESNFTISSGWSSKVITTWVKGWFDGTYSNYGISLYNLASILSTFTSSEGTDGQRPYLEINLDL